MGLRGAGWGDWCGQGLGEVMVPGYLQARQQISTTMGFETMLLGIADSDPDCRSFIRKHFNSPILS